MLKKCIMPTAKAKTLRKSDGLSIFANKVLLEHSHTRAFTYFLWLFSHVKRKLMVHKV